MTHLNVLDPDGRDFAPDDDTLPRLNIELSRTEEDYLTLILMVGFRVNISLRDCGF